MIKNETIIYVLDDGMYRVIIANCVINYRGTQVLGYCHECSKVQLLFFRNHLRSWWAGLRYYYVAHLDRVANLGSLDKLLNGLATKVQDQTQIAY